MSNQYKDILSIAVPSIFSNITIPLLGLIDVSIMGHIGNEIYISAIATGGMIFNVVYWLFGFLRMSTAGLTSQSFGKNYNREISHNLIRALTVSIIIAFIILILQYPIREISIYIISPENKVIILAKEYYDICIWGAPATLGIYSLFGWYIGMQNTKIPMYISIFQNIVNIIVSLLLVFVLQLDIKGVAFGTLIAQWSGFIIALLVLKCRYHKVILPHFKNKSIFIREEISKLFKINRDIFLRTLFLVLVSLYFTSFSAKSNSNILAANTLLLQFYFIFSYIMDGFAYAGEAIGGKYWGAKNKYMFRQTVKNIMLYGIGLSLIFTIVYAIYGKDIVSILTNNKNVISTANIYIYWIIFLPLISMTAFAFDGIFIGVTETKGMLFSTLISSMLFFFSYYIFYPIIGNNALWLAFLFNLSTRGIINYLWYKYRLIAKI